MVDNINYPTSNTKYSIKIYKQYFNFASSHFIIFPDGTREPLHGHNYRVEAQLWGLELKNDMVMDFLDIKPIIKKTCDSLDHLLLLPGEHPKMIYEKQEKNLNIFCPDGSQFSIPKKDVLILPIPNTSAENLAAYLAREITDEIKNKYQVSFPFIEISVEETPGQAAIYRLDNRS